MDSRSKIIWFLVGFLSAEIMAIAMVLIMIAIKLGRIG